MASAKWYNAYVILKQGINMAKEEKRKARVMKAQGPASFAMFVAFVGAFVYFARNAHDFVGYLNAFIDAVVWPGILVFHVLQMLHA